MFQHQLRRRIKLTREGRYYLLVLAFILLGVVLRQVNLLVVLAGLMVGLFMFHCRLTAQMLRLLDVRRRLPDWMCAGDPLLVAVTLVNRRRRLAGWAMAIEDTIVLEGAGRKDGKTKVELMAPRVEANSESRVVYRFDACRRGRYRFGPIRISTRFPFGLVNGVVTFGRHDVLLVCPRLGRLSRAWSHVLEGPKSGQARTLHRKGLVDGEFYGLREWRAGDSPRWIHWRTSAKLDKLAVRQFEQQRNRDVALVLDLWRPEKPSEADLYYVELAISFAATAIADICRRGGSRLVVAQAGASHKQQAAPASLIFMQDILQELAVTEAGSAAALPELLADVLEAGRLGERVIVISTRASQIEAAHRRASPSQPSHSAFQVSALANAAWQRVRWIDVRSPEASRLFRLVEGGESAEAGNRDGAGNGARRDGPPTADARLAKT